MTELRLTIAGLAALLFLAPLPAQARTVIYELTGTVEFRMERKSSAFDTSDTTFRGTLMVEETSPTAKSAGKGSDTATYAIASFGARFGGQTFTFRSADGRDTYLQVTDAQADKKFGAYDLVALLLMETAWTEGKGKMRAGAAGYLLGYDKAGAFTGTGLPAAEVWDRLASHSGTFSLYDNKKLVGSAVVRDIGVEATSLVPEPATWAMMIAGFALVGGAARRRRAMA